MIANCNELERVLLSGVAEMFARGDNTSDASTTTPRPNTNPTSTTRAAPEEEKEVDPLVVVTIEFVGEIARGMITLLSPRSVVDRFRPVGVAPYDTYDDDAISRDVLGEFANLMGGRLKRLLASHGIAVNITTPTTGVARNMRFTDLDSFETLQAVRLDSGGRVFVRLDASFAAGGLLIHSDDLGNLGAEEGTLLFFEE